jgi:hypothetical protein
LQNSTNFPTTVYEPINGLGFKETPIICGGIQNNDYSNKCYSLQSAEWVSFGSMTSVRYNGAAAQFQDRKLLVTGGYNGSENVNTAEMFSELGWESNIPDMAKVRPAGRMRPSKLFLRPLSVFFSCEFFYCFTIIPKILIEN